MKIVLKTSFSELKRRKLSALPHIKKKKKKKIVNGALDKQENISGSQWLLTVPAGISWLSAFGAGIGCGTVGAECPCGEGCETGGG